MFTATFEVLLFACQYEKYYQMYLTIVDAAWELFELERLKRHGGPYDSWCMVKRDEVGFSITRSQLDQNTKVVSFAVEVKNLGMKHPVGHVVLSSTSEEFVRLMAKQIEERKIEFSPVINVSFEKPTEVVG